MVVIILWQVTQRLDAILDWLIDVRKQALRVLPHGAAVSGKGTWAGAGVGNLPVGAR